MRYERPAIEARVAMKALLGFGQISGGGGDIRQPVWRSDETGKDQRAR